VLSYLVNCHLGSQAEALELGSELPTADGGDARDLCRLRPWRERDQGAEPVPDPGVDDGGHVAGPGQVPLADRLG